MRAEEFKNRGDIGSGEGISLLRMGWLLLVCTVVSVCCAAVEGEALLRVSSHQVRRGEVIVVNIQQDDAAGGVQFDLVWDAGALEYVELMDPTGSAVTNLETGRLNYIVSSTEVLPVLLAQVRFRVNGESSLLLEDVVMGTPLGEAITVETEDGLITIVEEEAMNFEAFWDLPAASLGVVETRVYVGNSTDIGDGSFNQVGIAQMPDVVLGFSLDANQGVKYAYALHFDAQGDSGLPFTPVQFSTDLELPAVAGFGVRVV